MWKILEYWTKKVVECCKWGLTGDPSRRLEDSSAESNVDFRDRTQEQY